MSHKTGAKASAARETPAVYGVDVSARGRMVIPAAARRRLGLKPGDRLILTVEPDGSLRLRPAADAVRAARGLYRDLAPGGGLVDDLLAQRRREAEGEGAR